MALPSAIYSSIAAIKVFAVRSGTVLLASMVTFLKEQEFVDRISCAIKDMPITTAKALISYLSKDACSVFTDEVFSRHIEMSLCLIREHFSLIKEDFRVNSRSMQHEEIQDEIFDLTASKLIQLTHGGSIILYLHQILQQNKSWIQINLGIPGMLSSDIVVSPVSPSPLFGSRSGSPKLCNKPKEFEPMNRSPRLSLKDISKGDVTEGSQGGSFESDGSIMPGMHDSFNILHSTSFIEDKYSQNFGLKLEVNKCAFKAEFDFNPLKCFDVLGESSFSKIATENLSFPWEALLSHLSILGLTEVNFRMLLSQRWDIRNDGILTSEETKYAEELKTVYK